MRQAAFAPRHLPIVPQPITGELISSWLLRVAACNCISLEELLAGVRLAQPEAGHEIISLDRGLPGHFRLALADFCRVSPESIHQLELGQQFPGVPGNFFLSYSRNSCTSARRADVRARYDFCLECLRESSRAGSVASIPAVWSLAPRTICHKHCRPLVSTCPHCSVTDPLLFPVFHDECCFRCRNCAPDLSTRPIPWEHAPHLSAVMLIEAAYLNAIAGIPPATSWAGEVSSVAFQRLVETFVQLFSNRVADDRHILARYFVDAEMVRQYFCVRQIAEARLEYFSWPWRYAVMFATATAILGNATRWDAKGASEFLSLLLLLRLATPSHRLEIVNAARHWPEPIQLRLWRAIKEFEGSVWESRRSLRFKCKWESPI